MLVVFAPSAFKVWNQMLWKNLQKIMLSRYYLHVLLRLLEGLLNLLCCGSISLKFFLIFLKNFLDFRFNRLEK